MVSIISIYLKDIKDLEIKSQIKKSEFVLMILGVAIILGLTLVFAQAGVHYLAGVLGSLIILLEFNRRGITSKGIIVSGELNVFGYWKRIQLVEIAKDDRVKVSITRAALFSKEVHFYDLKEYKKIKECLCSHLPEEKIAFIHNK